eukprot:2117795-Pyramimonas_sp.AAC.1
MHACRYTQFILGQRHRQARTEWRERFLEERYCDMRRLRDATGIPIHVQIDLKGKKDAFGLAKQPSRAKNVSDAAPDVPLHIRAAVDKPTAERLWRLSLRKRLSPQQEVDLAAAIEGDHDPHSGQGRHSTSSSGPSKGLPRTAAKRLKVETKEEESDMDPEGEGGTPGLVDAKLQNKWTQVGGPRRTEKRFEEFVREDLKDKH